MQNVQIEQNSSIPKKENILRMLLSWIINNSWILRTQNISMKNGQPWHAPKTTTIRNMTEVYKKRIDGLKEKKVQSIKSINGLKDHIWHRTNIHCCNIKMVLNFHIKHSADIDPKFHQLTPKRHYIFCLAL